MAEKASGKNTAKLFWCLAVGYMVLIFLLSSIEYPDITGLPKDSDKIIHIIEYSVLAALLYTAFVKSGIYRAAFLLSVFIASFYGLTDEFHQSFVPGRFASAGDLLADTAGALLGVTAVRMVLSYSRKRVG